MAVAVVSGSFAATGQSAAFVPRITSTGLTASREFNFNVWGTFVGTVQLERSFDGGTTWLPLTALGNSITFTAPCSEIFEEPEDGVQYRINCTAYTSGTINYRLSR